MKKRTYRTGAVARHSLIATAVGSLFTSTLAIAEPMFQQSIMPKPDNSRWVDNYVEFGAGGVKTDSATGKAYKFGEFTGLNNDDPFAIVRFNWLFRSTDNDANYIRANGQDLGLDTHKLSIEGGEQGTWDASFSAERLVRSELSPAQFVHSGLGSNILANPLGNTTITAANASLKAFDIEQTRDIYKLGFKGILSNNWDLKVNYREDVRDGNRLTGIYFNANPAVIVPYAIDDKTQQVDVTLGYVSKAIEGQLQYSYSKFTNNEDRFKVQRVTATAADAQMSLNPDNDYLQVTATGVYNFSKSSRAKAQVSYALARQNDTLLPYNSAGTTTSAAGTLPTSIDAKVAITNADFSFMTRPIEEMGMKVGYQFRDADNQTERLRVVYFGRDTTTVPTANSSNDRKTAPMSTREQRGYLDIDYEIAARTQLRGALEHAITEYSLADVDKLNTTKATLDLRRTFSDEFTGNLGYTFTQRTGDSYDKNVYFRQTYTPTYVSSAGGQFTNSPQMRSFMFNDYDEHRVRSLANWVASEAITLGASVDVYDRQYKGNECNKSYAPTNYTLPDYCTGTNQMLGGNVNFDLQWQPDENLLTFAFLTLGQTEAAINGQSWASTSLVNLSNPATRWSGKMSYTDETVGFGVKWQTTSKLELGGQYSYGESNGKTDIKLAVPNSSTMPDTETALHSINLFAKYVYSYKYTFRFNYLYENLEVKDWAYDGFTPFSNTGLIMTGQQSPKYENHVAGVSVAVSIW